MAFISYGQTFFTFSSKCIVFVLIRLFPRIIRYSKLYVEVLFALSTLIVECDDVFLR